MEKNNGNVRFARYLSRDLHVRNILAHKVDAGGKKEKGEKKENDEYINNFLAEPNTGQLRQSDNVEIYLQLIKCRQTEQTKFERAEVR